MALNTLPTLKANFGAGLAHLFGNRDGNLKEVLQAVIDAGAELQNLKMELIVGSDSAVAVAGITATDTILGGKAIGFDPDNATPADQVVTFTLTAGAGTVTSGTDSTGYDLLFFWFDKS